MSTSSTASDAIWKDTANLHAEQTMSVMNSIVELPAPMTPLPLPVYEVVTSLAHDECDHSGEGQIASEIMLSFAATELEEYLAPFGSYFKRSEGRQSLAHHLTGLLANIERKNGEQIAHAIAGTNSQRLQALLTELQWDAEALNQQRVQELIREATTRGGTLICGEVEMQKQGSSSVGVARQYVDRLGRTKNCQLLLSWQYVDSAFSWPVNAQLYLPQEWVQKPERCRRARIPEESRRFQTKSEIILSLLDEANRWGVPYRGIASTAAYGSDPLFLAELERRRVEYLVAVPEEFEIQAARRRSVSGESAKEAIARLADNAWQAISWPRGAGYGSRNVWARVMGWRLASTGPEAFGWLVAERPLGPRGGPIRYYFTNASPQTSLSTLARLARRPSRIDEFYQFAKSDLGWSHYEGRLWHGLHRHALLVFLAYSFLLLRRIRQSRQEEGAGRDEGGD
ncbi:MAG: IS701 family transposase [Candidatus Binatia bacterium]